MVALPASPELKFKGAPVTAVLLSSSSAPLSSPLSPAPISQMLKFKLFSVVPFYNEQTADTQLHTL